MACNCEGKTINIGMGCCQPVLAPIENYYTKWEVDELIESATTSGCCITPEEVDEKIEEAISGISFSGVTEEELNNAIASAKTEIEAEIPTVPTSNTAFTNDAGYLTEHQSLSGYATEQWVLDKNYITGVDLSNYATKDEIPTVPTKVSAFENDVPYLTEHQSLSGYVTDAEMSAYTYDKQTIDDKIAQGGTFDPTQYYNTAQTNNLIESAVTRVEAEIPTVPTSNTAFTNDAGYLTEHQSLSGYATEQWVLDKHYITGVDLSDYTTKEYVSGFTYDKATIDEKVASGGTFDPTQYYNKTATDALLNEKLDVTAYTPTDLSNYYNKQEVDNIVNSAKTEVEGEIPSLDGYATQQWVEDKHYITGVDLSDYALKSEIPIVPTSNTAFTNDAGYLTEHQSLSAYSTTDEVNSAITQATSGKANSSDVYLKSETSGATEIQNALNAKADPYSAGTGISIVGNVISATGGGGGGSYTAGRAIDLTNNVISFTLPISAGTGQYSIIENSDTVAGDYAHAEGYLSIASGYTSHAEGQHTFASGDSSHAEGYNTSASCIASHAEGNSTYAIGCASHTEGGNTIAYNDSEHASGRYNVSLSGSSTFGDSGNTLFTVGNGTGTNSRHNAFEIRQNGDIYITSGNTDIKLQDNLGGGASYSAGRGIDITNNIISFDISISGGSGDLSVAENNDTIASGYWSHAEGAGSSATSYASHAEGKFTLAQGDSSHAEGIQTVAKNFAEHASGRYNVSSSASTTFGDSGNTLFSVGNGTSDARHNAFEIRQDGSIFITSGGTDIKLQDHLGGGGGGVTSGEVQTMIDSSISGKANTADVITDLEIAYDKDASEDRAFYYSFTKGGTDTTKEIFTPRSGLTVTTDTVAGDERHFIDVDAYTKTESDVKYMTKSQIWCGTQAEYDALPTKENDVIYLIHN